MIISSGTYENDRMPRRAHPTFFRKEFVVLPNIRSGLTYGTPIWRKPDPCAQPANKPLALGHRFHASTTRRSSNEKSPASRGIFTYDIARKTR